MSEESKKFYRHALSIEVDYWASNSQQASNLLGAAEKTKVVVPHHSLPCILSWDEENTISVWDYEAKKLVWSRTLVQLVAELVRGHEISKPSKGSQSFVSSRAQSRGSAHAQLSNRSPSIPNKSSLTGEANAMGKNTHQFGELREVDFADKLSIAYRGGIANLPSESEIRYEHRLLLRFDTTIVLYNIFTNRFTMITANDLITKKIASCAFLSNDCLAVGCHDGNLKIWNIKRKLIERVFSVGQKDVTYINTIPLDSDAEVNQEITKIRIMTICDSQALFWCLHIKDGQVQSGFENAVAKFADNYKIPSDPLILIDRENQSIVIVFTDRKFSMWDLQDLTTAEANSRRPSIKRAPTGRHNSILGGLMKANVSIETDGCYLFNPHSSLKLDRKFPPTLSKLSSLSYSKHPYFSSNCMWICSKSASIALVQNKNVLAAGDESEKSSTVSGVQDKSFMVELQQEISILDLLNEHVESWISSGGKVPVESLKVYSVHSVVSRPSQLILTTSFGPLVLSLGHLPMNGYALSHFQWNSQKVLVSDCSLKRLALNANRDTDLITETKMNGPRGSKALLQASPSGDYVTVYWPEVLFYMIYDARSSSMEEIERGYCSEFAWTGPHNHFIIKTPAYYQVDKPTVRRSSIVNAFFKAEKVSKTYKPSELIAKQCLDKVTSPVVLESFDDQFHLIDLFSGNCLIANVVNKTTENNQLAMFQNPNPDTNLIPPKRTIFNFTESRLFAMKKKGGEESSMELVAVGPKALPGVMQLAWDYERSYVSLLHTNGCINVLHIDQNKCNSLLSLQSASPLCSFQCLSWFANCFAVCTYNQIHLHFVEEQNNQTTNQFIPLEQNPLSKFIPATEVVGSHQGFLFGSSNDGGLKCIMNLNNEASITNLAEVSAKDRLVWNVFEKLTSQVML